MNERLKSWLGRTFGAARVARLAPFFLMGPISGPFLAGVVLNFRGGRPVLGSLYAVALALWTLFLPLLTVKTAQLSLHHPAPAHRALGD